MRSALLLVVLAIAPVRAGHSPAIPTVVPLAGAVISPDAANLAFLGGDSLWIRGLDPQGTARAIAGDMADEHRIFNKFLAWSADGRRLAFRTGAAQRHPDLLWYDMASGRRHHLLPDSLKGRIRSFGAYYINGPSWDPRGERLAFAGAVDREPTMSLFLARAATAEVTRIPLPDGVTGLAWRPGGDLSVAIGGPRRPGAIMLIPEGTGAPSVLFRADSGQTLLAPVWHPSGDTLLIPIFQRGPVVVARGPEGWRRVDWPLPAGTYVGWDLPSGQLVATGLRDPMTVGLAAVHPRSGSRRWLTPPELNTVAATMGRDTAGSVFVVELQSGAHPPDGYLVRMHGAAPVNATRMNTAGRGNPTHASEVIRWVSPAGDTLHAQLLRAAGSPPGRRPAAIVPYGGYTNRYPSPDYFLDEMVLRLLESGWLVIKPNTRGISSQPQRSGYGRTQLEDTEALVRSLSARGVVDTARVAILGHSHGGSMAYYYATHSALPCATVAINGRADWILQARYENDGLLPGPMGATPEEAPALYARESPHANAGAVRGPLLAVSGAQDGQILPVNAATMADSLRAHGRAVTLLAFPDEGHLIERRPNRERLWSAVMATLASGCGAAR